MSVSALATFQLKNVSFEIGSGQYAVLMGRTGRGKTTILESLCGLRRVQSGNDHDPGDGRYKLATRQIEKLVTSLRTSLCSPPSQ